MPRKEICGWEYRYKPLQGKRHSGADLFSSRTAFQSRIDMFGVAFADCHLFCGKGDDPVVIGVVRDGCDGSDLTVSLRGFVHEWFLARNVPMGPAEVCMPSIHINMGKLSEVSPVFLSD